jgi:hypothetical protein
VQIHRDIHGCDDKNFILLFRDKKLAKHGKIYAIMVTVLCHDIFYRLYLVLTVFRYDWPGLYYGKGPSQTLFHNKTLLKNTLLL